MLGYMGKILRICTAPFFGTCLQDSFALVEQIQIGILLCCIQ